MKKLFLFVTSLPITVSILSQNSWSLTGNSGTSPPVNFVGTTDNMPLVFKVNNESAGFSGYSGKYNVSFGYLAFTNALSGTGEGNTAIGTQALRNNTTGGGNVAIGRWTLEYNKTGSDNVSIGFGASARQTESVSNTVAIGRMALHWNTKNSNVAIGYEAGVSNSTGEGLTAIGFKALHQNTSGSFNTAFGYHALWLNTTGYWNVALGSGSLQNNTTGYLNTAGGNSSLHFNQTGHENTAFGEQSLSGNIDGNYNTAVGARSLWSVNHTPAGDTAYGHGNSNTAVGYEALREITTGFNNVGMGRHALRVNNTGNDNVGLGTYSLTTNTAGGNNIAIGSWSLGNNTTGGNNTATGYQALLSNITGNNNTAVGYNANVSAGNLINATAIGYQALATASNQVRIGNSSVTSIGGYVSWSNHSDGRTKKNVRYDVPGLDFVNKLQPITYNFDLDAMYKILNVVGKPQGEGSDSLQAFASPVDKEARAALQERIHTGFVAQDVEKIAQSIGYNFSGVDVDEKGIYSLRYSEFVAPLVKAVQELSKQNEAKDENAASLQDQVNKLKNQVYELTELVNLLLERENKPFTNVDNSIRIPDASLEQNCPNPFNQSTVISYTVPQTFRSAKIVVADTSGRIFKQISISASGAGSVTMEAGFLLSGTYLYSLYVDDTLVDTKKMILTK